LAEEADSGEPEVAAPSLGRFVRLNILGNGASMAVGFVASVGLARWLGPSDRGLLGLMVSAATIVLTFTALGLPVSVVYFASRRRDAGPAILGNCILHAEVLALVLIPGALLLYQPIADALGSGQGGRTWALAAALVPITFLDWTTHSQLQGGLRFARFNVLLVAQRLTYALGVLILLGVLSLGVASGLIATALGSLVMIGGSLVPILRMGRPQVDFRLMGEMLRYGFRAQIGSLLQLANGRLDVIILQFFRPLSQVGLYVVAQTLAELVIQFADAFQWSNMALVSRGGSRDGESTVTAVRHHALGSGVAALLNIPFGALVILLAYGPGFHGALVPMIILLPGVWLLGIGFVVQGDLGGRGRPGLSSAWAGVAAVVTVGLDFALIPPFGAVGAAIASVCAYATFGLGSLVALHRLTRISLRTLLVPTAADLRLYASAVSAVARRVARRRRSA
jgi:O-antigen/teichoic acid export membrane protein